MLLKVRAGATGRGLVFYHLAPGRTRTQYHDQSMSVTLNI